jgi:hypothetical protein
MCQTFDVTGNLDFFFVTKHDLNARGQTMRSDMLDLTDMMG